MASLYSKYTADSVDDAVQVLTQGGVALLPADTVYGFFGRCDIKESTERVYNIKQRDRGKPFGIYTNQRKVEQWVEMNDNARLLIDTFWPKAMTVVLPHSDALPGWFTGIKTVGVLTAANPLISEIIERVDGPVFGTTVNYSGEPSIIHASEAMHFLDKVDVMIGDDSIIVYRQSSTIVDCTIDPPAVIREGVVAFSDIAEVMNGLGLDFSRRR
jgi:L-threonylcarbamoyladenylate synthase